jgi:hypothetical protein
MIYGICFISCDPISSTEASLNTGITQTTTQSYVAVTHIELILSQAEVCVGDQISLVVNVTPSNATIQSYTITLGSNTYVDFVSTTNQLLLEAIGEDSLGETVETIVTVTSDDNISISDTKQIYVHHSSSSVCT